MPNATVDPRNAAALCLLLLRGRPTIELLPLLRRSEVRAAIYDGECLAVLREKGVSEAQLPALLRQASALAQEYEALCLARGRLTELRQTSA